MTKVNVRELARNTSKVIDHVTRLKRAALVTRGGLPVAAIIPIDADALDDWILANAPDTVEGVRIAGGHLRGTGAANGGRAGASRRKATATRARSK